MNFHNSILMIQMHGFTCGVDDLLLSKDVDEKRQQQLEECERCGEEVHREVVGVKNSEFICLLLSCKYYGDNFLLSLPVDLVKFLFLFKTYPANNQ